jgi:hypothetical protein
MVPNACRVSPNSPPPSVIGVICENSRVARMFSFLAVSTRPGNRGTNWNWKHWVANGN